MTHLVPGFPDPADYYVPEWLDRLDSALDARMGIEILHLTATTAAARMPVAGNTQVVGILHGGASCVLAEGLGSMAAVVHGAASGRIAFGVDINATHHKSATAGHITGYASALFLGSSTASYEIAIFDDAGDRTCTARITCALRPDVRGLIDRFR